MGLAAAGLVDLDGGPPPSSPLPLHVPGEPFAGPLDADARAWLHVQCASCHQPGGTSPAGIDLRLGQPLSALGYCAPPTQGDLGGTTAILEPGHPEASTLWRRISAAPHDEAFMPPLGVSVPQGSGVALLGAWIEQLPACPP